MGGIHGERPISWQLDRAIALAEEQGRPIAKIIAAKPFVQNLIAELSDRLAYPDQTGVARYCGIVIETQPHAATGWLAYDANGQPIYNLSITTP